MKSLSVPLLFERGSDVWIAEVEQKPRLLLRNASCAAYHPATKEIAFIRQSTIWITKVNNPKPERPLCPLPAPFGIATREELFRPILSWHPRLPLLIFSIFQEYRIQPTQAADSFPAKMELSSIWSVATDTASGADFVSPVVWLEPYSRGFQNKGLLSASHPSWSPDGKQLAFARGGSPVLGNVASIDKEWGRWQWTYQENPIDRIDSGEGDSYSSDVMGCGKIAWRPDGREIVYDLFRWNGSAARWLRRSSRKGANAWAQSDFPDALVTAKHPHFLSPSTLAFVQFEQQKRHNCIYALDMMKGQKSLLIEDADYPVALR